MKMICNRFALLPFHCEKCHRYIWLEKYRKAEIFQDIAPCVHCFRKIKLCDECFKKLIKNA